MKALKHLSGFYIVGSSPWPLLVGSASFTMLVGAVCYFHTFENGLLVLFYGAICLILFSSLWFRDIIREATFLGFHTKAIQKTIYWGMVFFILSEIMFFFSFFWTFFYNLVIPSVFLGQSWPPIGVAFVDYKGIPFFNTIILVSSGFTITWAHLALKSKNFISGVLGLVITIVYGVCFLVLQMFEYYNSFLTIADSVYGSVFYMLTGFHGFHVFCGAVFLLVCLVRMIQQHFSFFHHVGYICAIWYWHFVDVVWLFVFFLVYVPAGEFINIFFICSSAPLIS
jgi:cytochrome c oxidase subunit 3